MTTVVTFRKNATEVVSALPREKPPSLTDSSSADIPPLGKPRIERRFFWHKKVDFDPDAIATQPSVYDDPEQVEQYKPRDDWENIHRFDPNARWTWLEEDRAVRKIDIRIMIWTCVMFIGLEIDRANLMQALSDNLLGDLGLDTNDLNTGNTIFSACFLAAELPSQLISKWIGPDRWIPAQLTLWSIVATAQFWLNGKTSFFVTRALLGLLQGGFIPDVILYLSYFYKHVEMSFRLGFFYMAMTIADILVALLASGLLQMRGVLGHAGWQWMFLIEGLLTLCIGLLSFGMMPAGPTETAGWFRGRKGWFTEREETIMVNRIIRNDPSKGDMHNRQRLTLRDLWKSICDYDLWPVYLIGLSYAIPSHPPSQYLTLSLRTLGFDTLQTNLLVIPSQVLKTVSMLAVIYLAEKSNQLLAWASLAQIWVLPFLIWLRVVDITKENPWLVWAMLTLLIAKPLSHPIQVGLASRNSNSVRSRTVSASLYNMSSQAAGLIGMNIYREDDKPLYRRGNSVLLAITAWNLVVYAGSKAYYVWRNKKRDQEWSAMTGQEQAEYLQSAKGEGSKRKDFRFAS